MKCKYTIATFTVVSKVFLFLTSNLLSTVSSFSSSHSGKDGLVNIYFLHSVFHDKKYKKGK